MNQTYIFGRSHVLERTKQLRILPRFVEKKHHRIRRKHWFQGFVVAMWASKIRKVVASLLSSRPPAVKQHERLSNNSVLTNQQSSALWKDWKGGQAGQVGVARTERITEKPPLWDYQRSYYIKSIPLLLLKNYPFLRCIKGIVWSSLDWDEALEHCPKSKMSPKNIIVAFVGVLPVLFTTVSWNLARLLGREKPQRTLQNAPQTPTSSPGIVQKNGLHPLKCSTLLNGNVQPHIKGDAEETERLRLRNSASSAIFAGSLQTTTTFSDI